MQTFLEAPFPHDLLNEIWRLGLLSTIALVAGTLAGGLLDSARVRGGAFLVGLIGLWGGSQVWAATGWESGPAVAGYGLVPVLAGAFAAAFAAKLVGLAITEPRR